MNILNCKFIISQGVLPRSQRVHKIINIFYEKKNKSLFAGVFLNDKIFIFTTSNTAGLYDVIPEVRDQEMNHIGGV